MLRVNETVAAKIAGIPRTSLRNSRVAGSGPTHIVINGRPYYDKEDVLARVAKKTVPEKGNHEQG